MATQLPPAFLNLVARITGHAPAESPHPQFAAHTPADPRDYGPTVAPHFGVDTTQPVSPTYAPMVGPNVPGQYQAPPDVGPHQISQPVNPVLLALSELGQPNNPGAAIRNASDHLHAQKVRAFLDAFLAH